MALSIPTPPADWRWQRAVQFAAAEKPGQLMDEHDTIRATVDLLRHSQKPSVDKKLFASVTAANFLRWSHDLRMRELECRVLNRQSPDDIAASLEIDAAAVMAYESLHFDVRPYLDEKESIYRAAIWMTGSTGGSLSPAEAYLRYCAFAGGSKLVAAFLDYESDDPDFPALCRNEIPTRPEGVLARDLKRVYGEWNRLMSLWSPAGDFDNTPQVFVSPRLTELQATIQLPQHSKTPRVSRLESKRRRRRKRFQRFLQTP